MLVDSNAHIPDRPDLSALRALLGGMGQMFMHLMASDGELSRAVQLLRDAGFDVSPSGRNSGGVHVRIRQESEDEETVKTLVAGCAPSARYGPPGSPVLGIVDYREGL